MRAWLKKEGLRPIKRVHVVGSELRYRIRAPEPFKRFITKVTPAGIHLVIGFT